VRLAGAIRCRRQIYNLGTQVDIRGSHWTVRSTHHQQYSVPERVVLPPTAEHHWLDLSRTTATSDRTTSLAQVSRSHCGPESNLVRAHVSLSKKCWTRTRRTQRAQAGWQFADAPSNSWRHRKVAEVRFEQRSDPCPRPTKSRFLWMAPTSTQPPKRSASTSTSSACLRNSRAAERCCAHSIILRPLGHTTYCPRTAG
jgi:hypothetical protein